MNEKSEMHNEYEVVTEKIATLLKQYKPNEVMVRGRDVLGGRYRVLIDQPLAALNSAFANAFAASDMMDNNASLYALVYENAAPVRHKNIVALKEIRHPNLAALLEEGVIELSSLDESRYVVIMERPLGQTLASLLAQGKHQISELVFINYFLRPLVEIIQKFNRFGISHNRINLGNIYLNRNTITLGECISEPSGYSQDFRFETIERAEASPMGKADFAIAADCYAIGVLGLHLMLGFMPFAKTDRQEFIENMLTKGSYHVMVIEWDFSETMHDFFRGLLNDSRRERWDPESMENWLAGRKFNLIIPSIPRETPRPFEFHTQYYYNRKIIANTLFRHWTEGRNVLADSRLGRWLEGSAHKVELAEAILRICSYNRLDNIRFENHNNESLARIIILLDPAGPIRLKNVAVHPEALPRMLGLFFLRNQQDEINILIHILESEMIMLWVEQQPNPQDYSQLVQRLQKMRGIVRIKASGFGVERCIYEMNPEIPCQSKLVKSYHVRDIKELLLALDRIAPKKTADDEFMDRHIAAFLSSGLDITKELQIKELERVPKLSHHNSLIGLRLLINAQEKTGNQPLAGLCYWVVMRLMPLTHTIHRRTVRERFQRNIMDAAATGQLKAIGSLFFNADIFVSDYREFQQAFTVYALRKTEVTELKNNTMLSRHSQMAGRGIAQIIAYGICLVAVYYTLKIYLHF